MHLAKEDRLFDFDQLDADDVWHSGSSLIAESRDWSVDENPLNSSAFVQDVDLNAYSTLRIRELPLADGVLASTGCQLWPAGIALARLLLKEPALVEGKSVIELGAGCGFAGIVAARLAERVLITDAERETVLNLRHNLLLNSHYWLNGRPSGRPPVDVCAETLLWEDVVRNGWPPCHRFDVLIGSDIIYGNWGPMVAKVAQRVLYPSGSMIMISALDRGGLPEFESAMTSAGYKVEQTSFLDSGADRKSVV